MSGIAGAAGIFASFGAPATVASRVTVVGSMTLLSTPPPYSPLAAF